MKFLNVILLFLVCGNISAQSISGTWVAVESRHYDPNKWISPEVGIIIDFDNSKFTHVFTDSIYSVVLEIQDANLIISYPDIDEADTLFIYHESTDSIVFLWDDRMLTKYIPLNTETQVYLNEADLIDNNWSYYIGDSSESIIHFLETNWLGPYPQIARSCIKDLHIEIYSLRSFSNYQLLTVTFGQNDEIIHQIMNYRNDTLFTKLINKNDYIFPYFVKHKSISKAKIDSLNASLQGDWEILDYKLFPNDRSEYLDTLDYRIQEGYGPSDSTRLKESSLFEKKFSYKFFSNKYRILENDHLIKSGTFKLSHDGIYIVLNNGQIVSDYLKIIDLGNNNMTISKYEKFTTNEERAYVGYNYEMTLIKRGTTTPK